METREVVDIVNKMAVPPGYKLRAKLNESHTGVMVGLYVTFVANSDGRHAPDYREPLANWFGLEEDDQPFRTMWVPEPLAQRWTTEADLFAHIMGVVLNMTCHEWREFLRHQDETGRWVAPLHPHSYIGQRAWLDRVGSIPSARLLGS